MLLSTEKSSLTSSDVINMLQMICVNQDISLGSLVPRVIRALYSQLQEHIFCNYMDKETWLRQCYSVQNGSFQGLEAMERVPMSKFVAMCTIHKEAMDQISPTEPQIVDPGPSGLAL